LCDVEVLSTLPLVERRAGLAEVVKSAWLDSEESVALLERRAAELVAGDIEATCEAVRLSVKLKARIVTEPGGAAAFGALLSGKYAPAADERVAVLVCGANTTAVRFE
jgi:threonine dehydratase